MIAMTITVGRKELMFRLNNENYEKEGYSLMVKNLNTHQVVSGGDVSSEEYSALMKHIRPFMKIEQAG